MHLCSVTHGLRSYHPKLLKYSTPKFNRNVSMLFFLAVICEMLKKKQFFIVLFLDVGCIKCFTHTHTHCFLTCCHINLVVMRAQVVVGEDRHRGRQTGSNVIHGVDALGMREPSEIHRHFLQSFSRHCRRIEVSASPCPLSCSFCSLPQSLSQIGDM